MRNVAKPVALLAALATPLAWGFDDGSEPVVPPFSGGIELGAFMATGNTETTHIKGKIDTQHLIGNWQNQYLFETLYSEDGDERSAERYYGLVQGNYPGAGKHYFFGMASGEVDKFSGYDYIATGAVGYGQRIIDQDNMTLVSEIGPGYSYKKIDLNEDPDGEDESSWITRVKLEYWWQFSSTAEFRQLLASDIAFDGANISRSETSVSAALIGNLAMKLSYNVKYNSDPVGDLKSTDTELGATLLYSF
ncbi:DUF481 domain-containing protein [Ferrimonas marina]|uniref:Putative salt-induced outer membrane protein YdiY n=1 Tax=Ferrimonas marina TaxID=299255 RepID=A0A1M5VU62_9GAMM|nr:DUF481 domain-containing protein [Ferrimonas marina]SHH78738.1 Putative salt-induced outer membrane protein YdiY [Ferrimonas marina]